MRKIIVLILGLCFISKIAVCENVQAKPIKQAELFTKIQNLELAFYRNENVLDDLKNFYLIFQEQKDNSYSLVSNQLSSIYLIEKDYEKAFKQLHSSYIIMNDLSDSYSDLEKKALGLMRAENSKMYKGDPYEKIMNAFYLSMLFYKKGDFDNALACLKTAILVDSDSEKETYKSDFPLLYVMASRLENLRGNIDKSTEYNKSAKEALKSSHKVNREIVKNEFVEKESINELKEKIKKYANKRLGKRATKKYENLRINIDKCEQRLKKIKKQKKQNLEKISTDILSEMTSLNNNVILFIEKGRGPIKYQTGTYGEVAKITNKEDNIKTIDIYIDGNKIEQSNILKDNSISYQAKTRGGREIESILAGQVKFKKVTRSISESLMDNSNAYVKCAGLLLSLVSSATNPAADVRYWSLLPEDIISIPLNLSEGEHDLMVKCKDIDGNEIEKYAFTKKININKENNIIFERIK